MRDFHKLSPCDGERQPSLAAALARPIGQRQRATCASAICRDTRDQYRSHLVWWCRRHEQIRGIGEAGPSSRTRLRCDIRASHPTSTVLPLDVASTALRTRLMRSWSSCPLSLGCDVRSGTYGDCAARFQRHDAPDPFAHATGSSRAVADARRA